MESRIIAVGDIHGCLAAFDAILAAVDPTAADTLVILGDYIDRGPASRQVVDRIIELGQRTRTIVLMGNHEEMLLLVRQDELEIGSWLQYGGAETLASYGVDHPRAIPDSHFEFFVQGRHYWQSERHFFVHGNYLADLPLERQPAEMLRWRSLREFTPGPHVSGKIAIVGHTAQRTGEVQNLGYLRCIDTYCHGGGWLTALDVASGQLWQANREGQLRSSEATADAPN